MATNGELVLLVPLQFLLPEQTLLLLVSPACTISFSRGSKTLAGAKSVQTISQQKGDQAVTWIEVDRLRRGRPVGVNNEQLVHRMYMRQKGRSLQGLWMTLTRSTGTSASDALCITTSRPAAAASFWQPCVGRCSMTARTNHAA